jgi:predicted  nucleic acid-binding Zn-ribbon protein
MNKETKQRDELEQERKSYKKKLEKLGEDLTELQRYHRKEQKKIKAKQESYEEKLAKIDRKLRDI